MSRSIEQIFMLMSTFECVFVIKSESLLFPFFSQCIQMLFLKMDFREICLQKHEIHLVCSPFLLIHRVKNNDSGRYTHWSFRTICGCVVDERARSPDLNACVYVSHVVSTYLNILRRFLIFVTKYWNSKTVVEHHAKRSVWNLYSFSFFSKFMQVFRLATVVQCSVCDDQSLLNQISIEFDPLFNC